MLVQKIYLQIKLTCINKVIIFVIKARYRKKNDLGGIVSVISKWKTISVVIFTVLSLSFLSSVNAVADNTNVYIENIQYKNKGLVIKFSSKTPFQTVQIDGKQILVAVKGGLVSKSVNTDVDNAGFITKCSFDEMSGDVVALVFYTKTDVKSISSSWLPDGNSLFIQLASI